MSSKARQMLSSKAAANGRTKGRSAAVRKINPGRRDMHWAMRRMAERGESRRRAARGGAISFSLDWTVSLRYPASPMGTPRAVRPCSWIMNPGGAWSA